MGSVYEALDPSLDRRVAIKVLHADALGGERLVDEGKAMARLNHPNVVTVYEVDREGERAFVVMELVSGATLRRWQETRRRSWREVLAMYRAVGAGIEAAHAAGLVHCDLKPENVLVGDDDRPRVTDFGIARLGQGTVEDLQSDDAAVGGAEVGTTRLAGTPRYMSPEQFLGAEVDHRSDLFAYCVMLWEALWGEPPFQGRTVAALAEAVLSGKITPPTGKDSGSAPRWLRRIVTRGLAVDPEQRWPSATALLDALRRGQSRARWRLGLGAVTAVGTIVAAVYGVQQVQLAQRVAECEAQGRQIETVWDEPRRAAVRHAVLDTEVSHAATTMERIEPALVARADAWQQARTEVCLRHDVEDRWDDALLERSLWCLDDRRAELEVVVEQLEAATALTVDNAVSLVASTVQIASCLDEATMRREALPPRGGRDEVRRLRRARARAQALMIEGSRERGYEDARQALQGAEALGWGPLVADLRQAAARAATGAGHYDEAAQLATDAYFEAIRHGAVTTALAAALKMIEVEGERRGRLEPAQLWSRHAEVLLDELEQRGTPAEASQLCSLGGAMAGAGRFDEARELLTAGLQIIDSTLGPEHPRALIVLGTLSVVARQRGQVDESVALATTVLQRTEAILGPEHPSVATALVQLGSALADGGRYVDALPMFQRALPLIIEAEGNTSPGVAEVLTNLGSIHDSLGQLEQAASEHERAIAIMEATLGPDHVNLGMALNNLGNVRRAQQDLDRAHDALARALGIFERALDSEYPHVAFVLGNLGDVELARGRLGEAARYFERSLAIRERELGAEHPRVLTPLLGLGTVRVQQGRLEDADAIATRAQTAARDETVGVEYRARASLLRGTVDWELGRTEPARQRVLQAREDAVAAGVEGEPVLEQIEQWLRERGESIGAPE